MTRPDWATMRPGDFDTAADVPLPLSTADLLGVMPPDDAAGTVPLF